MRVQGWQQARLPHLDEAQPGLVHSPGSDGNDSGSVSGSRLQERSHDRVVSSEFGSSTMSSVDFGSLPPPAGARGGFAVPGNQRARPAHQHAEYQQVGYMDQQVRDLLA